MTNDPIRLRSEQFGKLGALIQRHTSTIIDRWSQRATEVQPEAARLHHNALLDHLPLLLWELGRSLAQSGKGDNPLDRPARVHGSQRWEVGWSLTEVVRDYQILRLVLTDFLEEVLDRPMQSRENMALGVWLDEAIAASIEAYDEIRVGRTTTTTSEETSQSGEEPGMVDFLAVLGHELRNPLAPLRNALHVLPHVVADPERFEWTRALMGRQLGLLSQLVDDLLDTARVTRGKLSLKREPIDLSALVRNAANDRRDGLIEAGLRLTIEVPDKPIWVEGDIVRLGQVLGNLLGNAQKFTDRGGEIGISLTQENDRAVIAIRDSGIGIEPSSLARIFEAYAQVDGSIGRTRGGLGLGLALVRGFVEAHGGGVLAASDGLGTGTVVTFWLPITTAPTAEKIGQENPTVPVRPRRVLVIEDNADTVESLRMLLELHGHRVATATRGSEGVEVAAAWSPDMVICDIGLPGMDGFAVARELRANPATAFTRLICMSGYGRDDDQQAAREAGFDEVLIKPVAPESLARLFSEPLE